MKHKFYTLTVLFLCSINTTLALTLKPPRLNFELDRGGSVSSNIILTNDTPPTTANQSFSQTYYVEIEKAKYTSSGFSTQSGDFSKFIKIQDTVTVGSGQTINIPFLITLPNDAIQNYNFVIFLVNEEYHTHGTGAKVGTIIRINVPNGYTEEVSKITQPEKKEITTTIATSTIKEESIAANTSSVTKNKESVFNKISKWISILRSVFQF